MRIGKRSPLITLGLAAALMIPAAPAGALPGPSGPAGEIGVEIGFGRGGKFLDLSVTLGGHKRVVLELVKEYLAARDQGWREPGGPGTAMAAIEAEGAEIGNQARTFATGPSKVAAEASAAEEGDLHATGVDTGFFDDAKVKFKGRTATVTITSGTLLTWNDTALGDSSLSDTYIVTLEREGRTWTITDASYAPIPSTAAPKPETPSSTTSTTEAKAAPDGVSTLAEHTYDRDAAVAYALRWSTVYKSRNGIVVHEARNTAEYDDLGTTNCANFVSQALFAGGWPKRGGWNPRDPSNWTNDLLQNSPTRTWVNANWLFDFAIEYRGYERNFWPPSDPTAEPGDPDFAVWELQPGDLLFADWDTAVPDGVQDHVMIITGTYTSQGFTEPTYSQNSPNRHNLPLSIGMKMAYNGQYLDHGYQPVYTPVPLHDTFDY
ncbi:amidase domain-containing protein [Streptomyces albus]|uniref:amidase domain-containing protein n=1 Tax=Streptomyces albus TaxID=1888 RepID=UPI00131AD63A|nr:amidase domain-containing protein [Streptomyces albus]